MKTLRTWHLLPVLIWLLLCAITPATYAQNHVLSLDGDGDYVEIADSAVLNNIDRQVTMEAWVNASRFGNTYILIIYKGDRRPQEADRGLGRNRSYTLWLVGNGALNLNVAPSGEPRRTLYTAAGLIQPKTWYHVAGVVDTQEGVIRVFINGVEVARSAFPKTAMWRSELPLRIGWAHEEDKQYASFTGEIDEIRIWKVARTPAQIRNAMFTPLRGDEPGLVGYWGFEGKGKIAIDATGNGGDGGFIGDATRLQSELPAYVRQPIALSGAVYTETGTPASRARVRLQRGVEVIEETYTDTDGRYYIVSSNEGTFDLYATDSMTAGDLREGLRLHEGEHRKLDLRLKPARHIEGALFMPDGVTPHASVPVQAVWSSAIPSASGGKGKQGDQEWSNDEVIIAATTWSDSVGKYRFVNLKPGPYQVRCYTGSKYIYYGSPSRPLSERQPSNSQIAPNRRDGQILHVEDNKTLAGFDLRIPAFKTGTWKTYDHFDGLAANRVVVIHRAADGIMWFGTNRGISRYDGQTFVNFTTADGLAANSVIAIHSGPDGTMWFGTWGGGVSRYDGQTFVTLTMNDGLAGNSVYAIEGSPDGTMWFGTDGGVSRGVYPEERRDGQTFANFTMQDGLVGNFVWAIYRSPNGTMWFGATGGVSRYDGQTFVNFTTADGLARGDVNAIDRSPDGTMWFGTNGGASHYDGNGFVSFTTTDGLADNSVNAMYRSPDGTMWFGTRGGGVSRYDGETIVSFTTQDGLAHNAVYGIEGSPDGTMWFGTRGGGVSRYDGATFVNFTTADGLVSNDVQAIHREPNGTMWFGTWGAGISYYDGETFVNFTTADGLARGDVRTIYRDHDGTLWFGTNGGVSRYDGNAPRSNPDAGRFTNFTAADGLMSNLVYAIHQTRDKKMWFGTLGGLSRGVYLRSASVFVPIYRGVLSPEERRDGLVQRTTKRRRDAVETTPFVDFTTADGLADNEVLSIREDADGNLWFGTSGGVSRYDGETFVHVIEKNGPASHRIQAIHREPGGTMWFGTANDGVFMTDQTAWTSLDTRDGLAANTVRTIYTSSDGSTWFGTDAGVTHYHRSSVPSTVHIVSVTTDQTYSDLSALPVLTAGTRATIAYNAIDFKTLPQKRQYRVRLLNDRNQPEVDWRVTKLPVFDHTFSTAGAYRFEVVAIDRDLNYSEPVSAAFKVVSPWYLNGWILFPSGGAIVALLIYVGVGTTRYLQKNRQLASANEEIAALNTQLQDENVRMGAELQVTEKIQRLILPSKEELEAVGNLDIAGYMEPADEVGGDYYDVLQRDGRLKIAIGDVTGHGVEAGMVMLMTQSIVRGLLESGENDPVRLLDSLNRAVYGNVQRMEVDKSLTLCLLDYADGRIS